MTKKKFITAEKLYAKNVFYSKKSYELGSMLPHRYVLVLTNLCNLACVFCFQERKKNPNRMTTDDWLKFIKQIPENSRISITGGEPLVYKDFEKIFRFANLKNETNIISNGLLLNTKLTDILLSEKNFKVLGISIDTIGNTNRDFKKGQWEKLVENIAIFRTKRDKMKSNCAIDIKTVVLDENVKDISKINRFVAEELQADTHSIQLLKGADIQHSDVMFEYNKIHFDYKAHSYNDFEILIDELEKIRLYNLKNGTRAYLHPSIIPLNTDEKITAKKYAFLNSENHESKYYDTCYSPWTSVHINVDGNLFPCMAVTMGNVKKEKLNDIVFSDKFNNFKEQIKKNKTINGCNRCGWLKARPQKN